MADVATYGWDLSEPILLYGSNSWRMSVQNGRIQISSYSSTGPWSGTLYSEAIPGLSLLLLPANLLPRTWEPDLPQLSLPRNPVPYTTRKSVGPQEDHPTTSMFVHTASTWPRRCCASREILQMQMQMKRKVEGWGCNGWCTPLAYRDGYEK